MDLVLTVCGLVRPPPPPPPPPTPAVAFLSLPPASVLPGAARGGATPFFNGGDPPPPAPPRLMLPTEGDAAVDESKLPFVLLLSVLLPNRPDMKSASRMSAWESFNSDSAKFTSRSTDMSAVMGASNIGGLRGGDLPLLLPCGCCDGCRCCRDCDHDGGW